MKSRSHRPGLTSAASRTRTHTRPRPLPGRVVELRVKAGETVARGDVLAIVEGMKMQHAIRAGRAGRVAAVLTRAGELVDAEKVLFDIEPT